MLSPRMSPGWMDPGTSRCFPQGLPSEVQSMTKILLGQPGALKSIYLMQCPYHPCVGKQPLIAYKNFYFLRILEVPV